MEEQIKIQKCTYRWSEIENKSTNNFCKYCKTHVPDLSRKSVSEIQQEISNYHCARFHKRHLDEGQKEYYFINRFESKMEGWGFVKMASVLVLVYLFIVGCGMKHRTAGAYAYLSKGHKFNEVEIKSIE
ncbi:MAG: hypothetical protein R2799_03555 [Crocinitomicaceae bacterium]